jgi:hypothetical protein
MTDDMKTRQRGVIMNYPIVRPMKMRNNARKKIWEVSSNYYCSITGTCFSLEEARQILSKAGYDITGEVSDYSIHGTIISCLDSDNMVSKIVSKNLEIKYGRDISAATAITSETDLLSFWRESFSKGNIPGPYWAIMGHPCAGISLLNEAFGDVHMLSHLNASSRRGNIERITLLESEVEKLREEKSGYRCRIKTLEKDLNESRELLPLLKEREKELAAARKQIDSLHRGETMIRLFDELYTVVNMYEAEKDGRERASAKTGRLEKGISELLEQNQLLEKENGELKMRLRSENEALRKEISLIEKEILSLEGNSTDCSACGNEQCLCRSIQGKTILYVGGKTPVINQCRTLVEKKGGKFVHHDGGVEDNFSMLYSIIGQADVVVCPPDCISHNACRQVKRICGRSSKSLRLLRNSGVSSFLREIDDFFTHETPPLTM